jgi:phospholipase/carboxylesterase
MTMAKRSGRERRRSPGRGVRSILLLALLLPAVAPAAVRPVVNTHYYPISHVMKCLIYLPAGYDPGKAYPLLVALHGSGGSPELFGRLWERNAKAQCLLVAPEGPYVLPPEQRRDIPGYSWFLQVKDRRIWAMADPLVVQAMVATVAEIKASYKVGPVYILGFSQGASLAYQAALRHPDIFSGVLAVAGLFPAEFLNQADLDRAAPTLRVFIAHGSRDAVVKPAASEKARSFLEKAGFQMTFQAFRGGHELPAALFRDLLAWIGAPVDKSG